jgi:predicted AlkP superfamily phosphohydrolase/phosphomutase
MKKALPVIIIIAVAVLAGFFGLWQGQCTRSKKRQVRVAIIGIDAATWDIINPMREKGLLPNFEELITSGVHLTLRTLQVTDKSPVLWTSILTGKKPHKHGIKGNFSVKGFPVNSTMRRVKYMPQILSEGGYTVAFVGFWASWPAEKVKGWLVSDLISYGRFLDVFSGASHTGFSYLKSFQDVTYPGNLIDELYPLFIEPERISRHTFTRFAEFTTGEWRQFQDIQQVKREDDESLLKFSVATDLNFNQIGLYLIESKLPDIYAIYFEGLDIIEHFFWKYMEPQFFSSVSKAEVDRFGRTIQAYYQFMDDYLGETMAAMGQDVVYVILSDHGMIRVPREGIEGYHSGTHALGHPPGILVMSGPGIRKDPNMLEVQPDLLDITPTILYLCGMSVAQDMDGKVIKDVFEHEFLQSHPIKTIATYETEPLEKKEIASPLDRQIIQKLRAIGYIK